MKKTIFFLMTIGLTSQMYAQNIQLPTVFVSEVNYKYLNAVNSEESDPDVRQLHEKVALYNLKESDFYEDEFDLYNVSFFIPDGSIVAAYDKDGNILRTIEKFKSVNLPNVVTTTLFNRFPNWVIDKNVYYVTFKTDMNPKKIYKIKLRNGDEILRLKIDAEGNFM